MDIVLNSHYYHYDLGYDYDSGSFSFKKLMPLRKIVLENNKYYHVFNRSVEKLPILTYVNDIQRFLKAVEYYQNSNPPIRFSIYRELKQDYQEDFRSHLVSILAFTLMPNHFHFLLKQNEESGIQKFIQKLSNSFSHYYNLKYKRSGPLFEHTFKAVHIETEEQLFHISRYIHLNASTSFLVNDPLDYPYSSYRSYMGLENINWLNKTFIMTHFTSSHNYARFVLDNKDYQRKLRLIKHLLLE